MFFTKLIFCDLIEKSLLFETAIKMRSEKKKSYITFSGRFIPLRVNSELTCKTAAGNSRKWFINLFTFSLFNVDKIS